MLVKYKWSAEILNNLDIETLKTMLVKYKLDDIEKICDEKRNFKNNAC